MNDVACPAPRMLITKYYVAGVCFRAWEQFGTMDEHVSYMSGLCWTLCIVLFCDSVRSSSAAYGQAGSCQCVRVLGVQGYFQRMCMSVSVSIQIGVCLSACVFCACRCLPVCISMCLSVCVFCACRCQCACRHAYQCVWLVHGVGTRKLD